jgi:hypothetical protein
MTHEITLKVGSPHQLRDHILRAAGHCTPGGSVRHTLEDLLAQIEEQMPKPAVPEPKAFGSIVRASIGALEDVLWQRTPMNGKHYWESETGAVEVWSELTDVEVLRVGLGESDPLNPAEMFQSEQDALNNAFDAGFSACRSVVHQTLRAMHESAITAERIDALEKAIQAVEELAP